MTDDNKVAPHNIVALSPDAALADGLWWLKTVGEVNDSRNGRVVVSPVPVITAYPNPDHRVMLSPVRDANPFFHLFEALWMLAGRNDVAKIAVYAKQMEAFADDGLQWGAYGFRWREFFAFDQLAEIVELLDREPLTRRAVMTMWAPNGDLVASEGAGGITAKDVPCNTQVYFDLTRGRLNMTVTNRSNDIVWGAYGANLVHMSMLMEFVAGAVGAPLGTYYQFSNNYHAYIDRPDVQRLMHTNGASSRPAEWTVNVVPVNAYEREGLKTYPMVGSRWRSWLNDCEAFVDDPLTDRAYNDLFFNAVAAPMVAAHAAYKRDELDVALREASHIVAPDWRRAATEWLVRRVAKRQETARRMMEGGE